MSKAESGSKDRHAIIAVMGATGTGKSTFIKHLTGDENIVIGDTPDSETFDVETFVYTDADSGIPVMLVDTPGFDDSRDGVSDTDILEKIVAFLQQDEIRELNGIIFMHRISDPRMGGMSRKNLRMFKELCGSDRLSNVRIVTTNWGRVTEQEGNDREAALAEGPFKPLINAGAKMTRQDKERDSALLIMSELIHKPPVEVKVVEEMKSGKALADTAAGGVITEEIKELDQKHEKDMEQLKKDIEGAAASKDENLRAQLAAQREGLLKRMERLAKDRATLQETRIADLQKKFEGLLAQTEKLKKYAERGAVGRYFQDIASVTQKGAKMGGVPGAMVGLSVAPWVAGKRALFGR